MKVKYLALLGFLLCGLMTTAQRLGDRIKKELPDTLSFFHNDQELGEKIVGYYNELDKTLKLKLISGEEVVDQITDPKKALLAPFQSKGQSESDYSVAIVWGSSESFIDKINKDGYLTWDWNLGLACEIHAQEDWLENEMFLYYIAALERIHGLGQHISQKDIRGSVTDMENLRISRCALCFSTIEEHIRVPEKIDQMVPKGALYEKPNDLLRGEDIMDAQTFAFTSFEFNGKQVEYLFSIQLGMVYFQEGELDPEKGARLNREDLFTRFKFMLR